MGGWGATPADGHKRGECLGESVGCSALDSSSWVGNGRCSGAGSGVLLLLEV